MKLIGKMSGGDSIVSMTEDELYALRILYHSVTGSDPVAFSSENPQDIAHSARCAADIFHYLNEFQESLGKLRSMVDGSSSFRIPTARKEGDICG